LINTFIIVGGHKLNIQKSICFLYPYNELGKKEIKKTIPFTIASKIFKETQYLRTNSTKKVKELHNENYKTLKKEIKR
jgi:hypothetical protein